MMINPYFGQTLSPEEEAEVNNLVLAAEASLDTFLSSSDDEPVSEEKREGAMAGILYMGISYATTENVRLCFENIATGKLKTNLKTFETDFERRRWERLTKDKEANIRVAWEHNVGAGTVEVRFYDGTSERTLYQEKISGEAAERFLLEVTKQQVK